MILCLCCCIVLLFLCSFVGVLLLFSLSFVFVSCFCVGYVCVGSFVRLLLLPLGICKYKMPPGYLRVLLGT